MKRFNYILFIFLVLVLIVFGATSYRSNSGTTITINEPSLNPSCKKVINSGSKDIFIPTKTNSEWNSFLSNLPPGVSTSSCTCPTQSVTWETNLKFCSATILESSYGSSKVATDSQAPYTGTMTFVCTNGVWIESPEIGDGCN